MNKLAELERMIICKRFCVELKKCIISGKSWTGEVFNRQLHMIRRFRAKSKFLFLKYFVLEIFLFLKYLALLWKMESFILKFQGFYYYRMRYIYLVRDITSLDTSRCLGCNLYKRSSKRRLQTGFLETLSEKNAITIFVSIN